MNGYDPDSLDHRDPDFIRRLLPLGELLSKSYFRLRWDGGEHVPSRPTMFVANHNGGIMGPDLFCTLSLLWRLLGPECRLYALAHDFPMRQFTPLGRLLQKVGAVAASPANASRVLESGGHVLVYPGGDLEAYRSFRRRNEIVILPRTGFARVAKTHGAPIVPIVAYGAHRSACIVTEGKSIARRLGMPRWARLERFPLALALPWGVAPGPWLPYLPLPFPIRMRILPAVRVGDDEAPATAAHRIQGQMQHALDDLRHG